MDELSKSTERRKRDWRFANRWFVGDGTDVGCGNDAMKLEDWPNAKSISPYDQILGHKDAQYLPEIGDESMDFVVSAHCLEHLRDPRAALTNWLRVVKPGGFIVVSIPDEFLYEFGMWPSRFNGDHKVSFSTRATPVIPMSIDVRHLLWKLPADLEHLTLLTEGWDRSKAGQDQTLGTAECAIEFVLRKPTPQNVFPI